MKGFPDLPPIWMAAFGVGQWVLGFFTPVVNSAALIWISAALILAGLVLIAWSALLFLRNRTPIEPHHRPRFLIATGPYRLSRNPIYLAMALLLSGWTLWMGVVAGLLAVPVFGWVIARRFIRAEEAGLQQEFGAQADEYLSRTSRWLFF